MGLFSCFCRPSARQRNTGSCSTTSVKLKHQVSKQQHQQHLPHGSMDQSIDDESHHDQDDIRAVKSWREKKRIPLPPSSNHTINTVSTTALVLFDDSNNNSNSNSGRKLATIEEGTNDSRNTSVSVSPSLPPTSPSMIVTEDLIISTIPPLSLSIDSSDNATSSEYPNHHHPEDPQDVVVVEDREHCNDPSVTASSYPNFSLQPRSEIAANEIYRDVDGGPLPPQPHSSRRHHRHNSTQDNSNHYYYNGGSGGFPTLSPQEEEWRKEQHDYLVSQQQDGFLSSSSSNSTIEDPILVRTSIDDGDDNQVDDAADRRSNMEDKKRTTSGPVDLDEDYDIIDTVEDNSNLGNGKHRYNQIDNDEVDILSLSFLSSASSKQRPGPDNDMDMDRPMASMKNKQQQQQHTNNSGSIFSLNSPVNDADNIVSKQQQQQQEKSQSSISLILRDKEPELCTINNSAESEELDAMVAAIDSTGSENKIPPITIHPPPASTKDNTTSSRSMMIRSIRNSQSSPTIHLSASQQSSPSLHSGSRNSVPSIKLSPSRRDSPSVHDPTSYILPNHEYNGNGNVAIETGVNRCEPVLVSPSSDGSASIGPPFGAGTTTSTMVATESRRGRSTNSQRGQQFNDATMNTDVVEIPGTAQQRRKARSQSRGRRIRDRARTLLTSYNTSYGDNDPKEFHATSEQQHGNVTQNSLSTTLIPPVTMENGTDSTVLNGAMRAAENDLNAIPFGMDGRASNRPSNGNISLATTRSLYNGSSMTNVPVDKTFSESLRPSEMDHSDRLSDIPSEVDPMLRERYLKACRILKSSLLEKDATIRPSDKAFLSQLLLETTPSKDDGDSNDFLTEDKVKLHESSVHNTLFQRSTPLFDTTTTVVTTTDDFSRTTIDDAYTANAAASVTNGLSSSSVIDNYNINTNASGESSGVTEQELQVHNYVMNNQYGTVADSFHAKERQINNTTTASQVSSSVFSRVDDDYPYKVMGLDTGRHSKVLLPWMMNALRGFLPLEISNYNFWLKYQLDRNTDINHEDSINLMTLLSKVQHDTYSILCVETVDGYVFGAFCSASWAMQSNWYGTGDASFLWRLKHPRRGRTNDNGSKDRTDDRNINEIEIYPYTRYDSYVQYCSNQTLAVGGGTDWTLTKEGYSPYHLPPSGDASEPLNDKAMATGIGFLLDGDLMGGETNSCVTYANPRLGNNSDTHLNGGTNEFDIQTLEVYTFTKFSTTHEAEMKV